MIELARKVEEEMDWRVELNDIETCQDLLKNVEVIEQVSRRRRQLG